MKHITRKATRHISQNVGLIFEKSSPGKAAWKLAPLDVPEVDTAKLLGKEERQDLGNMPEVSEIEIIRHFTRLSTWNYAIDLGMYPLGSCTMKYNPRVNEFVSRVEGLANGHPYQAEKISQGALRIMKTLSYCLLVITGMDAITLQPAAGAHGELTGLLMVRAYHQSQGNARKKILIPDSAHGTNPATAATVGYAVENLKSNDRGMVDVGALAAQPLDGALEPSNFGFELRHPLHQLGFLRRRRSSGFAFDKAQADLVAAAPLHLRVVGFFALRDVEADHVRDGDALGQDDAGAFVRQIADQAAHDAAPAVKRNKAAQETLLASRLATFAHLLTPATERLTPHYRRRG